MAFEIEYVAECFRGLVRQNNEDNLWCAGRYLGILHEDLEEPWQGVVDSSAGEAFMVLDGIGGAPDGEVASHIAADAFDASIRKLRETEAGDNEKIVPALTAAMEEAVCSYAKEKKIHTMGTTAVGLIFEENHVCGFNLGDSRSYRLRDRRLKLLSVDDVTFSGFFGRNAITQYVGPPAKRKQHPHFFRSPLHAGDVYLVCSDGLSGMIEIGQLRDMLSGSDSLVDLAKQLKEKVLERGARDNTTFIICRVKEER